MYYPFVQRFGTEETSIGPRKRSIRAAGAIRLGVGLLSAVCLLGLSCHPSSQGASTYASLDTLEILSSNYFAPRLARTQLSFSYSPTIVEPAGAGECGLGEPGRVAPVSTAWGTPWDREDLAITMDRILLENGVDNREQRVRMIAHAIVASGWRQNVWNHNVWGVRRGSWQGPYYVMSTVEEDDAGRTHTVWDAAWRSFGDWSEAVVDFASRINGDSSRPSYRKAYRNLVDPDRRADARYWNALGEGNYYTATHFSEKTFARLCWAVRGYLNPT